MQFKGSVSDGAKLRNGQDYLDVMATVGIFLDGAKLTYEQDFYADAYYGHA